MSQPTPPLARRIHQAILAAYDHDALAETLYLDLQERLDTLVADKNFRTQLLELLALFDRAGRVPELLQCLCAERPHNEDLAALLAEAEQRQAQVGPGRPILGKLVPDAAPVPLQKPPRTPHFTGRTDELARLLADLQPGKVVTLCGPGGMGKSALAAEAVWTLSPGSTPPARFPDGIVFHTFYHQPQAALALEAIARAYGVDPRPSPHAAALAALGGRTALLVLDGAEAADDIKAVLAVAGGCGVLITTRRHRQAPDGFQDIVPLPEAQSLDLLRAWAGPYAGDDRAAATIVHALGGLPLALFLAGRYLAHQAQHAPEFVEWLQATGLSALEFDMRPSESIPLLLQRSLDQVGAHARAAFGVAGLLAFAPFARETVAAALELTPTAAGHALGELVDYGLLQRPDHTYQVTHALAHAYARTQAPPAVPIINRLATYYAAMAETESAKGPAGYTALDPHRPHIVAVQAAALKTEQWTAVRRITWKVCDYLNLQGHWTDRVTIVQGGLDAARAAHDRYDEGAFLNELGLAYFSLGEPRWAIELYKQRLMIAQEVGDRRGESIVLGNLGAAYAALGEPRRTIDLYEQALVIDREIGDRHGEGADLDNLGTAFAALSETRRAIELYEQALVIDREIGNRRSEGIALGNLGRALADAGDTYLAITRCRESLAVKQEIGDRTGEGEALNYLGYAYHAAGSFPQALDLHRQAVAILAESGALEPLSLALADLAETHLACGDYAAAAEAAARAAQTAAEHGFRLRLAAAFWAQARAEDGLSNSPHAVDLAQQALAIYSALDHTKAAAIQAQMAAWQPG